jgi:hypothetical protein
MVFHWEWLRGELDALVESKSFAALKIDVGGEIVTRLYDRVAEGARDTVKVPLYPLALALAENWWTVLYEPRKSDEDRGSANARHSLDSYMSGFVFPALTIWSGGDNTIVLEHPNVTLEYSSLEFLPRTRSITNLTRDNVEQNLFELGRGLISSDP